MDNNPILKKQLSIKYAGSMERYEHFRRTMGASPLLYSHDFLFYNDDIIARHSRNIKELSLLKSLLREDKIEPSMLSFNVINTYYPSYILHHHYDVFIPLLANFASNKDVKQILTAAKKHAITGAFFHQKVRLDLKDADKSVPTIDDSGIIQMPEDTFFYSGVTSPYITHSAFIANHSSGPRIVVVLIKDNQGSFCNGIKVKDLGATASNDYLPIGYNFSGVKSILAIEINAQVGKKVYSIGLKQRYNEFNLSLIDLQKSLWITVNYTKMRKQFKTNDNNKQERRIITYQAVASRIINAFSQFIALSDLNSRIIEQSRSYVTLSEILESAHHIILEQLIHLRECCGGFGYMQVSGHPGCIERVCFRAGLDTNKELKLTPLFLQATQYFASSEESEKYYCQPITSEKPSYMNYFGIFLSIIFNMRKEKGNLNNLQFKREFLKQSSLLAMHARQQFSRGEATSIHCQLLQYSVANYILKNPAFISWELIKIDRSVFLERLYDFKNQFLQSISLNLQCLGETLELSFLRNTIVGRQNAQDFYSQVLTTSKGNMKNEKSYLQFVQAPLVEMITTSRGKL